MAKTIVSSATFPVSPRTLYRMFLSSKEHAAACGADARIAPRVGGAFSIFEGSLTGRTLLLKPGRMIVQAWRSSNFKPGDADSVLVLNFSGDAKRGKISLVHVNVPDQDADGVRKGWPDYYWKPWAAYLARTARPSGKRPVRGKRRRHA